MVSEGGLGMREITEPPRERAFRVEFALPGEGEIVRAESEIAWVRETEKGLRAGVRFTQLAERDRLRIRSYVECAWAAA